MFLKFLGFDSLLCPLRMPLSSRIIHVASVQSKVAHVDPVERWLVLPHEGGQEPALCAKGPLISLGSCSYWRFCGYSLAQGPQSGLWPENHCCCHLLLSRSGREGHMIQLFQAQPPQGHFPRPTPGLRLPCGYSHLTYTPHFCKAMLSSGLIYQILFLSFRNPSKALVNWWDFGCIMPLFHFFVFFFFPFWWGMFGEEEKTMTFAQSNHLYPISLLKWHLLHFCSVVSLGLGA